MYPAIEAIKGGLVVSCQAYPGEPLRHPETMAQMAMAAVEGGAVGIRCQGLSDIAAIKGQVEVPVIGIWKDGREGVYITPTLRHARCCASAGADIVAIDATGRPRPDGRTYADTVRALHDEGIVVMADCGSFADAERAVEAAAILFPPRCPDTQGSARKPMVRISTCSGGWSRPLAMPRQYCAKVVSIHLTNSPR